MLQIVTEWMMTVTICNTSCNSPAKHTDSPFFASPPTIPAWTMQQHIRCGKT